MKDISSNLIYRAKILIMELEIMLLDESTKKVELSTDNYFELRKLLKVSLNLVLWEYCKIISALIKSAFNRELTAYFLGISERTLYRKLIDYKIYDMDVVKLIIKEINRRRKLKENIIYL